MRLRSHLLLLSIATAAPVVALAVVVAVVVVKQERDTLRDAAGDRVIAVMSAVDAELRGSIATLRAFHAEARRILGSRADWLNFTLARPDGTRIADAGNPPGTPQEPVVDRESFDLAVRSGEPVVGSLTLGPAGRNFGIPLRLPVLRNSKVQYVLTAVLKPDTLTDVLRAQRFPEGWVAGIADRHGRIIARQPPVQPGAPVAESFRAAPERLKQVMAGLR